MNGPTTERSEAVNVPVRGAGATLSTEQRRSFLLFGAAAIFLCLLFSGPFINWLRFALAKERNTYLLLVPVISAYLIRTHRSSFEIPFQRSSSMALIPAIVGLISLFSLSGVSTLLDRLSLEIFALLNFLLTLAFLFVGRPILRQFTFPISFLIFAVPVPMIFADAIETFLQYTSAEAAYWLMSIVGIPMVRDGVNFRLPNLYFQVAQECSGYNSTFALLMVSLVAGYLFLKYPSRRFILSLAVIPLAIFRNGFRITTLASLCVYNDPAWIDSDLHHKGGPIFFTLSLIPFFILLW